MGILTNISNLFLGGISQPVNEIQRRNLSKYQKAMEDGSFLNMSFTTSNAETGDLKVWDDDITVVMPADQLTGEAYDLRYLAQKLRDQYCVVVTDIDMADKIVYVSHYAARKKMQPSIIEQIDEGLAASGPIQVKGKVVKIQRKNTNGVEEDTGVWLDLCGVGVAGWVYIGDWKKTFTSSLRGKVRYGDVIDVLINERVQRSNGSFYYSCSRKELVSDPWMSSKLDEYNEGDLCKIRCTSKRNNNWFGEIEGLSDIEIFTEYPSRLNNFPIVVGMSYMAKIYRKDVKQRVLKARPFEPVSINRIQRENDDLDSRENDQSTAADEDHTGSENAPVAEPGKAEPEESNDQAEAFTNAEVAALAKDDLNEDEVVADSDIEEEE